jgi:hypothetical protein
VVAHAELLPEQHRHALAVPDLAPGAVRLGLLLVWWSNWWSAQYGPSTPFPVSQVNGYLEMSSTEERS